MRRLLTLFLLLLFSLNVPAAKPFIIDTDMNIDDVFALLYLLKRQDIDIKAITISSDGASHCAPAFRHLAALIRLTQHAPIPYACGSSVPLRGHHHFPDIILQQSDNLTDTQALLPKSMAVPIYHADDLLIQTLQNAKEPVNILSIGTFTNLAAALKKAIAKIK